MIYAVIDTNVFVSAFWTKNDQAATYRLSVILQQGGFTILYDDEILAEYKEVLSRPYFDFVQEDVDRLIDFVKEFGIHSDRVPFDEDMTDETDRVFYEVALSREDSYLVTGNLKHFPKSPIVVTPAEMLEILEREG